MWSEVVRMTMMYTGQACPRKDDVLDVGRRDWIQCVAEYMSAF